MRETSSSTKALGAALIQLPPYQHRVTGNKVKPHLHEQSGCVIHIEEDPIAAPERFSYRCTLDGKPIGYATRRLPTGGQAPRTFRTLSDTLADAADFIADCFNVFDTVVIERASKPSLSLVQGGLVAKAA